MITRILRIAFRGRFAAISTIIFSICILGHVESLGQQGKPSPTPAIVKDRSIGNISGEILDEGGKPIVNASVLISALSGNSAKTEATDEQGKFTASNLVSGTYRMQVRSPGYVQPVDELRNADGTPRFYRTGESLSLTMVKGGVITGTVTDASGNPLVGINVTAIRVRQPNDTDILTGPVFGINRPTDDRGIYRIYGLSAGRYMVYAGAGLSSRPDPFDRDAPTYYPSSNRDTAGILDVQLGQEVTSIDIRYRGERGYAISGTLTGNIQKFAVLSLVLPGNLTPVTQTFSREQDGRTSFIFPNVTSGNYKVVAFSPDEKTGGSSSGTVSVSVKNGDVAGVVVNLTPLGSINGRVALVEDQGSKCGDSPDLRLEQVILRARGEKQQAENVFTDAENQSSPTKSGEFRIVSLPRGNYRLQTLLPGDEYYVRSVGRATQRPQSPPSSIPAESFALNGGDSISDVTVNLSLGAGSVVGRILYSSQQAENAPARSLFLVPSEKERADDTLRFGESPIAADGTFSFRNLAPGRYSLISRTVKDADNFRPLYWDAKERASLIAEAASAGLAVEIKPCQSIRDLAIKLGPNGSIK